VYLTYFIPILLSPSPLSVTVTGPHPSEEGRGTVWGDVPWFGTSWGGEGEGGGGGERRKMNP